MCSSSPCSYDISDILKHPASSSWRLIHNSTHLSLSACSEICVNSISASLFFSGKDVRLTASMADSIAELKKQLEEHEEIDMGCQRWFFSGKLLTDKTRLQDAKIQKDYVVQVIVNTNPPVIANWGS